MIELRRLIFDRSWCGFMRIVFCRLFGSSVPTTEEEEVESQGLQRCCSPSTDCFGSSVPTAEEEEAESQGLQEVLFVFYRWFLPNIVHILPPSQRNLKIQYVYYMI